MKGTKGLGIAVALALALVATALAGPVRAGLADPASTTEAKPTSEGCSTAESFYEQLLKNHAPGEAVPLKLEPTDEQLAKLGLPPEDVLTGMQFEQPTMVSEDGSTQTVPVSAIPRPSPGDSVPTLGGTSSSAPAVAAFAGTGCLGIRPGGLLLVIDGGAVIICSLAHVYGSEGSYDISTAGHCIDQGQTATVIGAVGNNGPVLIDFGTASTSTANGIGDDYAVIDIDSAYQHLVTPTMCAWGGPFLGAYTNTGQLVSAKVNLNHLFHLRPLKAVDPQVEPDPTLAQGIEHYGHGLGIGTGGTPRAGAGFVWASDYFLFTGAIAPGDSGSGANTATSQAAGIITHIIVDPLLRKGIGIAAGTRVTEIGTPAQGLPVGTPAPLPT